jgi:hypothetical protein
MYIDIGIDSGRSIHAWDEVMADRGYFATGCTQKIVCNSREEQQT